MEHISNKSKSTKFYPQQVQVANTHIPTQMHTGTHTQTQTHEGPAVEMTFKLSLTGKEGTCQLESCSEGQKGKHEISMHIHVQSRKWFCTAGPDYPKVYSLVSKMHVSSTVS